MCSSLVMSHMPTPTASYYFILLWLENWNWREHWRSAILANLPGFECIQPDPVEFNLAGRLCSRCWRGSSPGLDDGGLSAVLKDIILSYTVHISPVSTQAGM